MVSLGSITGGAAAGAVVSIVINAIDNFSDKFNTAEKRVGQINKRLLGIGTGLTAAGVGGALAIKSLTDEAGKAQGISSAFNNFFGKEAPANLAKLTEATRGTVSEVDLMTQANQALLLGIDPEALPAMFEGAFAAASATGRPVADAIRDITTGIGRQSRLILDNLGIIVSQEKANVKLAAALGKTTSELTEAEKKQAFMNATMEALNNNAERIGPILDTAAIATQQATKEWDDAKLALGLSLAPAVQAVTGALGGLIEKFNGLSPTTVKIIGIIAIAATAFALIGGPILILISILPLLATGFGILAGALGAVSVAGAPVFLIILAIIAAIALVIAIILKWSKILDFLKLRVKAVGVTFLIFKNLILLAFELIKIGVAKVTNFMIDSIEGVATQFVKFANKLIAAWNLVARKLNKPVLPKLELPDFTSLKINTDGASAKIAALRKEGTELRETLKGLDEQSISAFKDIFRGGSPEGAATPGVNGGALGPQNVINIENLNATDPADAAEGLREELGDREGVIL